ncbi:hypothetical protein COH21_012203, partial [Aspergillus flavus]
PQLLQDAVLDKLETDGDKLVQSFSDLWSILVSASANSKAGEIICTLDALDESAMRPLSLEELSLVLAVNAGHESLTAIRDDVEPKDRFRKTLRDLCGLFVVVVDEKAYLLHQTAKEFLVGDRNSTVNINISKDTRWKHSILPEKSHYVLANTCSSYITVVAHQFNEYDFEEGYDKIAYLEYSSRYWIAHFRQTCVREESPLLTHAQRICDPNSDSTFLLEKRWNSIPRIQAMAGTPLSWAAGNDRKEVVELLLATGKVGIDSKDSTSRIPLFWAAKNGDEAVVELLLATGKVDIDARDSDGQTPLSWAARNGHEAVVKLLQEFHQLAL